MLRRLALSLTLLLPASTRAQRLSLEPHNVPFWIGAGALVLGAATVDERMRHYSLTHRSGLVDTFADAGGQLGRGQWAMLGLGAGYVGARLAGRRDVSDKIKFAALGYAASNVVVAALKTAAGRHRPDSTGDAWRFRPFHTGDRWYALPSAHAVHAFSLAAALDAQTRSPWIAVAGYGVATMVAWSRVYDDSHWSSDVVLGAAVGIASGYTVVRWMERRKNR